MQSIHNSQLENPNIQWADVIVDALAKCGLKAVCVAPGSRSTPLTLAFDAQPEIEVYMHLDERCAAFFALGMALATDSPVALVCTSGTAVANFFPAIVEAKMSQVPLLVLTADRPPELRHSGANQTIDQVKIFGDQVLWSVDVALPEVDPPSVTIRNLRTLTGRAFARANGVVKGPVHLNFPFRKPLEPAEEEIRDWRLEIEAHSRISDRQSLPFWRGTIQPTTEQIDWLTAVLTKHEYGLIVCGPRCPGGDFPTALAALSRQLGYPILADPLSGLRFGVWAQDTAVISGYETFLQADPGWREPDVILRFGAVPTSKWLNAYLDRIHSSHRIHIRENGIWADDTHRTTTFLQAQETAVCYQLISCLPPRENEAWVTAVTQTDARCWSAIDNALSAEFFDGGVVADVVDLLPPEALLFMGNSLPVRHLDQFGRARRKPVHAYANRGASGIDGNVSTALGMMAAQDNPGILVIGDITFYHDLNGLLAVKNMGLNTTIVLLNNGGGGIFNRLPISQIDPPFTELFLTPHGLAFEPAVRMYGLGYVHAGTRHAFRQAFAASLLDDTPRVIEVRTDSQRDEAVRQKIINYVSKEIGD